MEKLVRCEHWKEYLGLNGWVMYCGAGAFARVFTRNEAETIGCTDQQRLKCIRIMETNLGFGIVPVIEEGTLVQAQEYLPRE